MTLLRLLMNGISLISRVTVASYCYAIRPSELWEISSTCGIINGYFCDTLILPLFVPIRSKFKGSVTLRAYGFLQNNLTILRYLNVRAK